MDKVAKGPDYNTHTHTKTYKQKIMRYVRVELPAKRQITTTSNLQREKKLKQKFKAEKRNGNNLLYL